MSEPHLFGVVYACVLLTVLSGMVGVGDLTWKGHAQAAAVLTGLLVLYRRHGDRLAAAARPDGDEAGSEPVKTGPAAALVAMALIFIMAQYAPPRFEQLVPGVRFAVVTALVLVMFTALVQSEKRACILPFTKLDWLAVAAASGGLAGPLLADVHPASDVGAQGSGSAGWWTAGATCIRAFTYVLAWFAITRCCSDPRWGGRRQRGRAVWVRWMGDRWWGSLASVVLLLGASLTWGAVRAGAMVLNYQTGRTLGAAGNREIALVRLSRALELSTELEVDELAEACLSELAVLHFRQGRAAAGQLAVQKLANRGLDDPAILRRVADIWFEVGRWRLAAAAYEAHLRRWGWDATRLSRLGNACLRSGDGRRLARVLTTYQEVPGLRGANADEHLLLGRLFSARDDRVRAVAEYAAAARNRPRDPYIQYKLGWSQMRAGQLEDATRALERSVVLAPDFAEAAYRLGLCQEKLGRDREAAGRYRQVLKQLPSHLGAHLGRRRLQSLH